MTMPSRSSTTQPVPGPAPHHITRRIVGAVDGKPNLLHEAHVPAACIADVALDTPDLACVGGKLSHQRDRVGVESLQSTDSVPGACSSPDWRARNRLILR